MAFPTINPPIFSKAAFVPSEMEWQGEFINKEGKWFNYIIGEETSWWNGSPTNTSLAPITGSAGNIDTQELAVQGVGFAMSVTII